VKELFQSSFLRVHKRRLWQIQTLLASISILALLAVRLDAPGFGSAATLHPSFQRTHVQDKKQCLECDQLDWAPPAQAFQSAPPTPSSPHLDSLSTLRPQQDLDGTHHNRPPPLG